MVFASLSRLACYHVFECGSVKRYLLSCCCSWSVLYTRKKLKEHVWFSDNAFRVRQRAESAFSRFYERPEFIVSVLIVSTGQAASLVFSF